MATNINLPTAEYEVRRDGAFVRVRFSDAIGQSATITLSSQFLFAITADLVKLTKNVEVRENQLASSSPAAFTPMPLTLLVNEMAGNRDEETGHLQLRVLDTEEREALISFSPEDSERLFQILLETQRFDVPDSDAH